MLTHISVSILSLFVVTHFIFPHFLSNEWVIIQQVRAATFQSISMGIKPPSSVPEEIEIDHLFSCHNRVDDVIDLH